MALTSLSPEEEKEARQLVHGGIARDMAHATEILLRTQERRERSDLRILYMDTPLVRDTLPELMGEKPYNSSTIRIASVPSGSLDKVKKHLRAKSGKTLALGKIMELISEGNEENVRLGAEIRNLGYDDKPGIHLDPVSMEEMMKRGTTSFAERNGLYRIEIKSISEDYVFGMFAAWERHPINGDASLMLYISRSRVLEI